MAFSKAMVPAASRLELSQVVVIEQISLLVTNSQIIPVIVKKA
jgi:hypothetical protein